MMILRHITRGFAVALCANMAAPVASIAQAAQIPETAPSTQPYVSPMPTEFQGRWAFSPEKCDGEPGYPDGWFVVDVNTVGSTTEKARIEKLVRITFDFVIVTFAGHKYDFKKGGEDLLNIRVPGEDWHSYRRCPETISETD